MAQATAQKAKDAVDRARVRFGFADSDKIKVLADGNPKRGKARKRFAKYKSGMTVGEAFAAGITRTDVAWDRGHGFIAVAGGPERRN